jgi:hypothetical protein
MSEASILLALFEKSDRVFVIASSNVFEGHPENTAK